MIAGINYPWTVFEGRPNYGCDFGRNRWNSHAGVTMHLDEVQEAAGVELPEGPYETLAGFILATLGHIPTEGEIARYRGWSFEVLEMDRRRIAQVRVTSPREAAR